MKTRLVEYIVRPPLTDIELVVEQSSSLITLSKTGILPYRLEHAPTAYIQNRETSLSHDTLAVITRLCIKSSIFIWLWSYLVTLVK
jgi:hypothetical protein